MADLQRRGSYTPRRTRERRAYQLVMVGGVAGLVGVVSLVLAIVGAISATLPIVALIIAVMCAVLFRRVTGMR
jgi:putative flippase GtrA